MPVMTVEVSLRPLRSGMTGGGVRLRYLSCPPPEKVGGGPCGHPVNGDVRHFAPNAGVYCVRRCRGDDRWRGRRGRRALVEER